MITIKKIDNSKKSHYCPLCSSDEIIYKYSTKDEEFHIINKEFDIYLCTDCKSYFINPIPNKKEIDSFYKFNNNICYGAYKPENPEIKYSNLEKYILNKKKITYFDKILLFALKNVDNRFLDLITYVKRRNIIFNKVLDVGCGNGYFLKQLVKYLKLEKSSLRGIDIYPEIESLGKTVNIKMERAELENYQEMDFDLIILSHVLEHVPNPRSMIKEIFKRLSKNGIFFLSVPNSQSLPAYIFGKRWICHSVPRHIYNFSKEGIIKITQDLFELENYSTGDYATCIFDLYYNNILLKKIFGNYGIGQVFGTALYLLDIGDSQSFIFKKKNIF